MPETDYPDFQQALLLAQFACRDVVECSCNAPFQEKDLDFPEAQCTFIVMY